MDAVADVLEKGNSIPNTNVLDERSGAGGCLGIGWGSL
jgi:hypothetical protein